MTMGVVAHKFVSTQLHVWKLKACLMLTSQYENHIMTMGVESSSSLHSQIVWELKLV